ncbi:hypothetical protein EYF80_047907 [Liparis tanakae]|uniref:Uncharacterized protein n=1 Tax=Liparis tanakae TaxID=230148 RepID=A0A4Z2FLL4_9TELE|nr:hypothetical protein EYF80_047907 [Liparis tanakae]
MTSAICVENPDEGPETRLMALQLRRPGQEDRRHVCGRSLWVEFVGGVCGRSLWVEFMGGVCGLSLWVEFMGGPPPICELAIHLVSPTTVRACGRRPTSFTVIIRCCDDFRTATASSCGTLAKLRPFTSRIWSPTCGAARRHRGGAGGAEHGGKGGSWAHARGARRGQKVKRGQRQRWWRRGQRDERVLVRSYRNNRNNEAAQESGALFKRSARYAMEAFRGGGATEAPPPTTSRCLDPQTASLPSPRGSGPLGWRSPV